MKVSNSVLIIGFLVCLASALNADKHILIIVGTDNNDTTTVTPENITTTEKTTTTPLTTSAPLTTTSAAPTDVLTFQLPKNESVNPFFKARFTLTLNITYLAKNETVEYNATASINVTEVTYDGTQTDSTNVLTISTVPQSWTLTLAYVLKNSAYVLSNITLDYTIDKETFPDAVEPEGTKKTSAIAGLNEFSANKGNSYKCYSETDIAINEVDLIFKNYQAEPFLDGKSKDFDTAIECPSDQTGTSELVPIIVGTSLAVLVVFVLIAYIIGRRKHRPGYVQV